MAETSIPTFDHSLPMILSRTLDAVMPVYRELFSRYDLTEQQWRVLRVIWTGKKVTSAELSERTLLSPPSLVGIIDRLEKKQLVTRMRSVSDRRAVYIIATQKGRTLQAEVTPQVSDIQARMRVSVSEREWLAMERTLSKIAKRMRDETISDVKSA
jgi:homoprotocatechuate degradation regulator HpaR